jgi:hypothetical protein
MCLPALYGPFHYWQIYCICARVHMYVIYNKNAIYKNTISYLNIQIVVRFTMYHF